MGKVKQELKTNEDKFPMEQPDYIKQDSVRGQENVGTEDLSIPRLDVIQDLSPQHKENKPEYIEGAKVGMLFNSVTQRLYGIKVFFIPVYFRKEWVIWKNMDAGGGFFGAFNSKNEAEAEANNQSFNVGEGGEYEIVDTAQHFGIILNSDHSAENPSIEEVVISMSKSKMKPSRSLNTMAKLAGGDRFSRVYEVSAIEAANKAGQEYYNLGIKQLGYTPQEVYMIAEKMYDSIASGQKDVNRKYDTVSSGEDDKEFSEDNPK